MKLGIFYFSLLFKLKEYYYFLVNIKKFPVEKETISIWGKLEAFYLS